MERYDPLKAIFREIDEAEIVARKEDAIRHHFHSAFWLIADGRSPVSVHLLVMAAHEMLTSIAHKRGREMLYEIKGLRRQESREDREVAKFLYNFFKHARNDEAAETKFSMRNLSILNEITLAASCVNFRSLFNYTDATIERFLAFHAMRFRAGLSSEEQILIAQIEAEKPITEVERIRLLQSGIRAAFANGVVKRPFGD